MNVKNVGEGKVVLIAGGDKIYTDIAARFCRTEKQLEEIIGSEYDKNIVKNILSSGHMAATEFDYFIFGIEGYARVTEVQLVRKRLASYLIKSGRPDKGGKRSFDMVLPEPIMGHNCECEIDWHDVRVDGQPLNTLLPMLRNQQVPNSYNPRVTLDVSTQLLLDFTENWYNTGVDAGLKEEELRYMKQQGTEFKAIIGMNIHALRDWWLIRLCMNAQTEIRDLAMKTFKLTREAAPDLCIGAGPSCVHYGYCPENARQHCNCKGKILTKDDALEILKQHGSGTSFIE